MWLPAEIYLTKMMQISRCVYERAAIREPPPLRMLTRWLSIRLEPVLAHLASRARSGTFLLQRWQRHPYVGQLSPAQSRSPALRQRPCWRPMMRCRVVRFIFFSALGVSLLLLPSYAVTSPPRSSTSWRRGRARRICSPRPGARVILPSISGLWRCHSMWRLLSHSQ